MQYHSDLKKMEGDLQTLKSTLKAQKLELDDKEKEITLRENNLKLKEKWIMSGVVPDMYSYEKKGNSYKKNIFFKRKVI